jgi:hypothetical protein
LLGFDGLRLVVEPNARRLALAELQAETSVRWRSMRLCAGRANVRARRRLVIEASGSARRSPAFLA